MNIKGWKRACLRMGVLVGLATIVFVSESHSQSFKKEEFTYNQKIVVDVEGLQKIAQEVSDFFKTVHVSKYVTVSEGTAFAGMITLDDVKETIDFLAQQAKKNPGQLKKHWFYKHYFDFYRWHTDGCMEKMGCIPRGWPKQDAIRLTKYRMCKIPGSRVRTDTYSFPLYEVPVDEKKVTPAQAAQHQDRYLRFLHSRSAILEGVLEGDERTKVLAWVKPEGYKELAMQGSALINFGIFSGDMHLKVARHNGKDGKERYWFSVPYVEKKSSKKWPQKVEPIPGVSFAGNISALGFGKVILLLGKNPKTLEQEMRVGVLVDTGDAFKDNLCKLDLFTGYFEHPAHFDDHCKNYPHTAHAYVLIKKKKKG